MAHEIRAGKNFKNRLRPVLLTLLTPPITILALTLLCLGQQMTAPQPQPELPAMELKLPLLAHWEEDEPENLSSWDGETAVTVSLDGKNVTLSLADYLWGVVAAEMPAGFEQQALNAQACAARTYTVYKLLHPTDAHEADLCDNTGCCQAWMSREERMEKWGENRGELAQKIDEAIAATDGMAVCYEGEVIQAVFHAASAEMTRSAADVWGSEVAYLQSVHSPEGEEVPNYYSVVTVSPEEFQAALPQCSFSSDPSGWIGKTEYDDAGLSRAITIGGKRITTAKLRSLFSLRSSCLEVEASSEGVTFYVTGYGHGVGLSQYGANALAKQGLSWQEILTWYYSGVSVEKLADKSLNLE